MAWINSIFAPQLLFIYAVIFLSFALIFYRRWTNPWFAGLLLIILGALYAAAALNPNFFRIVCRPDNLPITLIIFSVGFFTWLALRRAAINDGRIQRGEYPAEGHDDDRVLVWPDLVYIELILIVICTVVLIVWSILLRAPLESPADPALSPNPAKAPWYFVGLQELLVYFDPWIAGVMLPGLIIFGLCALPYLDKNPRGNGYYTLKERPLAVGIFLFGFIVLWIVPIVIGVFLRGPNWTFYGPFEYWDPHKPADLVNVNLAEIFWLNCLGRELPTRQSWGAVYYLIREAPGLLLLISYFVFVPWILKATLFKDLYVQMGRPRYAVMAVLLTCMALVPVKMLLRWIFDLKYIVSIAEWSLNI
ncbi:MAG: hypothetical protein ACYTF1_15380 [Planctomycetota bacterium]